MKPKRDGIHPASGLPAKRRARLERSIAAAKAVGKAFPAPQHPRMGERGFEIIQLALVLAIVAALAGACWYIASEAESYGEAKFEAGEKSERGIWQARESTELAQKNTKILELEGKVRALEQKSADDIKDLTIEYEKDITNANNERDRALAERRSGAAFGLRWKPDPAPAGEGSGGNPGPTPGAAAGEPGAAASCGLPADIADALIREAGRADQIVAERNEAVGIAKKDREICGGQQP